MRSRKTQAIPARLEAGRRRFERWRRTRQGHSRIPEPLWTSAVKLARAYGLCRTARTLCLDYNALKQRVASVCPGDSLGGKTARAKAARQNTAVQKKTVQETATAFVELEHPHGAKMRIHLKGATAPDLAALGRSFWGIEP